MQRKKRPPPQELAERRDESLAEAVREVVTAFIAGQRETEVLAALRRSYPDLTPDDVLTAAVGHFLNVGTVHQKALVATFGWCLEAAKDLYRRMLEKGEFVDALKAVKLIKELADQAATLVPEGDEQDVRDKSPGCEVREEEAEGSGSPAEDRGERP